MKKAMLTFGITPPYKDMLAVTMPGKLAYAVRHGYTVVDLPMQYRTDAPLGWWKIRRMIDLLADYDAVLNIDADVLICDATVDIAAELAANKVQAIALHGNEPNDGVWLVTRGMLPVLDAIDMAAHDPMFRYNIWCEQAALMAQMGYEPYPPYARDTDNALWHATQILGDEWNWHFATVYRSPLPPRFRHAAAYPEESRAALLAEWRRMFTTESA